MLNTPFLETKFAPLSVNADAAGKIKGYAAIFGTPDRGGDVIAPGAFAHSLKSRDASIKLLWQHDPAQPIGVWDHITEDAKGLFVTGGLLTDIQRAAEASVLLKAGALDGLSIGYRAVKADRRGDYRYLTEIELWEISLVTFPMAPGARLSPPDIRQDSVQETTLAAALTQAARAFQ